MPGLLDLDHATLLRLRDAARSQAEQDELAKFEHRAFARELVRENPYMALPMLAATPLYQAAKVLNLTGSRSRPSMEQMGYGLLGIKEGLFGR